MFQQDVDVDVDVSQVECFNSFILFMDWTGQCYGLPATPTTDILSKVLDSFDKSYV